jgi:hypothetical protein
MPITEPDNDPKTRKVAHLGGPPLSPLDADLDDPWWTTPCEDCGEVPIRLVPYGVNECKCLRERDR